MSKPATLIAHYHCSFYLFISPETDIVAKRPIQQNDIGSSKSTNIKAGPMKEDFFYSRLKAMSSESHGSILLLEKVRERCMQGQLEQVRRYEAQEEKITPLYSLFFVLKERFSKQ